MIAAHTGVIARAAAIFLLCLFCLGAYFSLEKDKGILNKWHLILIGMMGAITVISLSVNQLEIAQIMRGILQAGFIFTIGLLLPHLLEKHPSLQEEITKTAIVFIALSLIISTTALFYHIAGWSPNSRLVHPVNPYLWALASWFLSYRHFKNNALTLFFTIVIIWTGSRVNIAIISLAFAYYSLIYSKGRFIKRDVMHALIVLLVLMGLHAEMGKKSPLIEPLNHLRLILPDSMAKTPSNTGFLTNREIIFAAALEQILTGNHWWSGYGREFEIEIKAPIREDLNRTQRVTAHNVFLRLSFLYGLFFAVIAYAAWFHIFLPRKGTAEHTAISHFFFWGMTGQSLFFSTFWTNMADPAAFFVCLWLITETRSKFISAETSPVKSPC